MINLISLYCLKIEIFYLFFQQTKVNLWMYTSMTNVFHVNIPCFQVAIYRVLTFSRTFDRTVQINCGRLTGTIPSLRLNIIL